MGPEENPDAKNEYFLGDIIDANSTRLNATSSNTPNQELYVDNKNVKILKLPINPNQKRQKKKGQK